MALIQGTIPNLINGVSQQPQSLRLPSQAQEQINGFSNVAEGLQKRPGTRHVARVSGDAFGPAYVHTINRDVNQRFTVLVTDGDLKVFTMDGEPRTVNFPAGKSYLQASDPSIDFRAVTVADYTFIVNRKKVVAVSTETSPPKMEEGLIAVKQGSYAKTYTIYINGNIAATTTTPNGSVASQAAAIDTVQISGVLYNQLVANLGPGWATARIGSSIYIRRADGGAFTMDTVDGMSGTILVGVKGTVQKFTELPNRASHHFLAEIAGDPSSGFDNYYVRYESEGVWKETIAPGLPLGLDPATMPHVLIRENDGTFTFKPATWDVRQAGDEVSVPQPSFVGRTLSDVFFYRNRLGVIADENVVFSRAGEFFNFYRTTATTVLDTDPIDLANTSSASNNSVSVLNFAVPFAESLLLFSDQTQFVLKSGDILTAKTASIVATTEFETSRYVKPVGAGSYVYFTAPKGAFDGLREYSVNNQSDNKDATDVTAHVPRFVPTRITKLAAATNEDVVVALSNGKRNSVYVYKYYWSAGQEKLQSSWSRWDLDDDAVILNADFLENTLFLLVQRPDGVDLESITIASGLTDEGGEYLTHLDRRLTEADLITVYDPSADATTVYLPYTVVPGKLLAVTREGDSRYPAGYLLHQISSTTSQIVVRGNQTAAKFFVGLPFTFEYEFSQLMVRGQQGTASQAGRLQLQYMSLSYNRTGYFEVHVTPQGRDTSVRRFSTRNLGSTLGPSLLDEGNFRFPIGTQNTTARIVIKSDSFLPLNLTSAEWEGNYITRARRF